MKLNTLAFSRQHFQVVFIIATLSVFVFISECFLGDSFTQALVYQRQLITQGEVWRLFSGHILHTNGYHLLLNLAALFMLWALHGRFYSIKNYTVLFLLCSITTSTGIYYFDPTLRQYVGLSGVLHGVFVFGALMDIRAKDKTGYLLFLGVWLKIAHEQFYGASTDVSNLIEANVAVNAHLWGALGGLLFSFGYLYMIKSKVNH
ncbi:MAG: rhombosortase [Colwellia sp.]|nr:MAG: rhombosortase [Colwellia sp.]